MFDPPLPIIFASTNETGDAIHIVWFTARTRSAGKGVIHVGERVTVTRFDDVDNALNADETIVYSLDGTTYEIDLSDKNARQLRTDIQKWIPFSRRVSGPTKTQPPVRKGHPGSDAGLPLAEIRKWAIDQGIEVPNRGRVSAAVVRAWRAANSGH